MLGEVERRREEVRKLEELGRLLESSPTQQLAQMAAEAGPSTLAGGGSQKETPTNHGRQGSQKGVSEDQTITQAPEVLTGIVALHEICQCQKSTELLIWQTSLLMSGLQNSPRIKKIIHALPGAHSPDFARS